MNLLKAFRTKDAGLPVALQWQYIKGVWMPYDAKDGIYIDKAYLASSHLYSKKKKWPKIEVSNRI